MSNISSIDGSMQQYYQKKIADLEDEYDKRTQKNEKKHEEQLQRSEENYKAVLRKKDKDNEETLQKVKDSASAAIESDRRNSKAEVDRIKAQTYDRYGRYNGLEAGDLKAQLDDLKRAHEVMEEKHSSQVDNLKKAHDERVAELYKARDEQIEKALTSSREVANEALEQSKKTQSTEYQRMSQNLEERANRLAKDYFEHKKTTEQHAQQALEASEKDFERREKRTEDAHRAQLDKRITSEQNEIEAATHRLNASHDEETRQYRDQVKELIKTEGRYAKEKGQGTLDAVREYENRNREEKRQLVDGYEKQLRGMGDKMEEAERSTLNAAEDRLRAKDAYYSDLVTKMNQDSHDQLTDVTKTFQNDRKEWENIQKHNEERAERRLAQSAKGLTEQNETALKNQGDTYQKAIARQHQQEADKVKALEDELKNNRTKATGDKPEITPAMEMAIRKSLNKEYSATFDAERERNQKAIDSLQRQYDGRFNELIQDKQARETEIAKQNVVEHEIDRMRFMAHIQDSEMLKGEALRNKDQQMDKVLDELNRTYSRSLNQQKREYEEILNNTKDAANYRIASVRQEADFTFRQAQRDFNTRQNELIRGYDKKLAEQKAEFEARIDEQRLNHAQVVREMERKMSQALDEQARSYEQRIAQGESSYKERERSIVENYQDTIEKIKRSNALLIQKKG